MKNPHPWISYFDRNGGGKTGSAAAGKNWFDKSGKAPQIKAPQYVSGKTLKDFMRKNYGIRRR